MKTGRQFFAWHLLWCNTFCNNYDRIKLKELSMRIKDTIESKLQILQPEFLEVINESHNHNVPPGSESHFKVIVVTNAFQGKMLVARHRMVNDFWLMSLRILFMRLLYIP